MLKRGVAVGPDVEHDLSGGGAGFDGNNNLAMTAIETVSNAQERYQEQKGTLLFAAECGEIVLTRLGHILPVVAAQVRDEEALVGGEAG
jgi:diaminopimelate decarboxylase